MQHEACKTEFAADSALGSSHNQRANLDRGVLEAGPLGEIGPEIRGDESRGCLTVRLVDSHPLLARKYGQRRVNCSSEL